MGRQPSRNLNLPEGMRARHRKYHTYYFLDTGAKPRKEIALGSDYVMAVKKWAEMTKKTGAQITFDYVAGRYENEVMPTKAPRTQLDNNKELAKLREFFSNPTPAPMQCIEPITIRQYLDWRKDAKTRANREKALFSHIWNFAREKGLTNKPNPCAGIKGYKEEGRDIYVDDQVYKAVQDVAEERLRDAMDIAYLTGQRPADVLKMTRKDLIDGAVKVVQNKRGKKLRVSIEGDLKTVLDRIAARKVAGITLVNMTVSELRGAFDRARITAAEKNPELADDIRKFQFRDLRAKAGTDTEEHAGMDAAQAQLGHTTPTMTAHYVRHRRGKLVKPTK